MLPNRLWRSMSKVRMGYVVLTRSEAGNRVWASYLTAQGFRVYTLPTIQTLPLPLNLMRPTLEEIAMFEWIVFTSAAAAWYVQQQVMMVGGVWPLQHTKVAVIGPQTALAVRAAGLTVSFQPSIASRTTLGEQLPLAAGARILLPQTTIASTELGDRLEARGARVTRLSLYETHLITGEDQRLSRLLLNGKVAGLIFASASAVRGTLGRLSPPALETARQLPAVALGEEGVMALRVAGFRQVHRTATPTVAGVAAMLQDLLS